jgi:hypothetical protein
LCFKDFTVMALCFAIIVFAPDFSFLSTCQLASSDVELDIHTFKSTGLFLRTSS